MMDMFYLLQNKAKKFRQLLISWIKTSGFSQTIVLSSSHAYQRDDQQLKGYLTTFFTASLPLFAVNMSTDKRVSVSAPLWGTWSLRPCWRGAQTPWRSSAGGSWSECRHSQESQTPKPRSGSASREEASPKGSSQTGAERGRCITGIQTS